MLSGREVSVIIFCCRRCTRDSICCPRCSGSHRHRCSVRRNNSLCRFCRTGNYRRTGNFHICNPDFYICSSFSPLSNIPFAGILIHIPPTCISQAFYQQNSLSQLAIFAAAAVIKADSLVLLVGFFLTGQT